MMPAKRNLTLVSLQTLLDGLLELESDVFVTGLKIDARTIQDGDVFIAVAGSKEHGLMYADQAVKAGAIAIIYDPSSGGELLARQVKKQSGICLLELADLGRHLSAIASRFYQHPSDQLSVIGITGTNGKTSVSHFIAQALNTYEKSCGLIGTLGWGQLNELKRTMNTTPDAISVQNQLAVLRDEGCNEVAMEVSSHGLDQGRVKDVHFKGAVFTNLSHDHLDYHRTIEAYGEAKLALFKCPSLKFVVLNRDDPFSATIEKALAPSVAVYSFSRDAENPDIENSFYISNEQLVSTGLSFDVSFNKQIVSIHSTLFGAFNVDNIVASLAVLVAMGDEFSVAAKKVGAIQGVSGRMQHIAVAGVKPTVIVDYAHTPDALKLALMSLREHGQGALRLVFGCGGNRDQAKRPLMGAIAAEWADQVVITNDNPRFESARHIAEQIKAGANAANEVEVVLDRAQAIKDTIMRAAEDDIVLIAGKGHEEYQQIGSEKIAFSDIAQVKSALKAKRMLEKGGDACKT